MIALTGLAAGCTSATSRTDAGQAQAAPQVTSGPETGHLFAHGAVHRGDRAVPGADAVISLWPETADDPVGALVDLHEIPVVTDAQGRWAVQLDPDAIPAKYFPASRDFVNFDLRVVDGPTVATWSTTLHVVGDPGVWRTDGARPGDAVMEIDIDLDAETITITDSHGEATRSPLPLG